VIVEFVVAEGKREQARWHARIDGDAVVSVAEGPATEPADVVFTMTPADAQALRDGTLDLSVAYMRGQVKMAGDFAALLRFLPLTHGPDAPLRFSALQA
jgi:putative sterol carrier protein